MTKEPSRKSPIFLGPNEAPLLNRLSARAIDMIVTLVVYFIGGVFFQWFGVVAALLYCAVQDSLGAGQSVGKRMMGLQVVEEPHRIACSAQASVIRNVPFLLFFGLSLIPALHLFYVIIALPVLGLEINLLYNLESGARLGDILANTAVVEYDA